MQWLFFYGLEVFTLGLSYIIISQFIMVGHTDLMFEKTYGSNFNVHKS